jgi:hypothetical protein
MKSKTQTYKFKKDCKHSMVFEPVVQGGEKVVATSIYIPRDTLEELGATRHQVVKLTLSVADGDGDQLFANLK